MWRRTTATGVRPLTVAPPVTPFPSLTPPLTNPQFRAFFHSLLEEKNRDVRHEIHRPAVCSDLVSLDMTPIFTGTYNARIDDSGRVCLPAAFRVVLKDLSSAFLIFPSPTHRALEVWSEDRLQEIAHNVSDRTVFNRFAALAMSLDMDGRGRFVLHRGLKKTAGLRDRALFVGMGDTFRIWNPDTYQEDEDDPGGLV